MNGCAGVQRHVTWGGERRGEGFEGGGGGEEEGEEEDEPGGGEEVRREGGEGGRGGGKRSVRSKGVTFAGFAGSPPSSIR